MPGARRRVAIDCGGESRTKQSFRSECDINAIMDKYRKTGVLQSFNATPGRFGDFSNVGDYFEAVNRVRQAEAMFAALPSEIRDAVENDPGKLLDLVLDPSRKDELKALGLVPKGFVEVIPPEEPAPAKPVPKVVPEPA